MDEAKQKTPMTTAALGALLGLLLFSILVGFGVVRPSHISWLLDSPDPMTHYLGWAFFRHDAWHWPPGLNPNYGLATGSSIVYSDSIPLLALLFKPLSRWLGGPFQYTGLWLLICFILQGIFAMLLAGRILTHRAPQILAALLLMLPFVFLKRLDGHYALAGQWLVLAALNHYFRPTKGGGIWWIVLAIIAVLVHLYLAVLVLAVWAADLTRRYIAHRRTLPLTIEVAIQLPILLFTMYLAGYFCLGFSEARTPNSAGAYSMNLLSPIDSRGFSLLFPPMPLARDGQIEGAAYLGLGLLLLIPITLLLRTRPHIPSSSGTESKTRRGGHQAPATSSLPLLIVSALLLLFAISPIITVGRAQLLALPNYWGGISEVLRAAGRMTWPAVYLLPLLLISLLSSRLNPRPLTAILAAILIFQFLDLSPMLAATRRHFHTPVQPVRTLTDPFWTDAPRRYSQIILVPSDAPDTNWQPLAFYAADHRMAINHGYFARMDWHAKEAANRDNAAALRTSQYRADAIYILTTDDARALVPHDKLRHADGYTIFVANGN